MKINVKIGIGCIIFAIFGMCLISLISYNIYGRIYMYNGYVTTGLLWTICFISLGIGIFFLSLSWQQKHPKISMCFVLFLLAITLVLLFKACGVLGEVVKDSDNNACGICDGVGLVPKDKGLGFTTCPYCKGTGIPTL